MVEGSGIQSEEGGSAAWVKHHKRNEDITSEGHEVERPKVVSAAIEVERLAQVMKTFTIEFTHILWGTAYYKEHGRYVDENVLDVLKIYGVALFRSVEAPSISPPFLPKTDLGTNEINRCPRPHLHLGSPPRHPRPPPTLHQRPPVRTFPGIRSPSAWSAPPISTGSSCVKTAKVSTRPPLPFSPRPGREVATEVATFTYVGVERIIRFSSAAAQARPRKLSTVVTKSNSLRNGMVLWDEVAVKVSKEFPDVKWDKMLVDVMTVKMVNKPKSLDTIVGTNLHMDILTDLAAALAESIGVAPSSNLDQTRKNPNLFEPVHGSAFNITRDGLRIRWLLLGVQLRCWGDLGGKRRRGN